MLPESLSQIGPIATLTRIIPGYSSLAITPMVAVLTVITLSLYGVRVLQSWRGLAISFIAAASLLTRSVSYPTSHTLQTPLARLNLPPEILSQKFVDAHPFLVSPSFNVFSSFNYLPLFHPEKTLSESRKIAIPFERLLTQSSPLTDERILKKAFDGSEATRWSPKEGGQRGGEWLTFPLPPTTPLDGIGLLTGPYVTDFPRGLTVTHQPECDGPPEKNELLFSAPHWLGPLKKTDDGYPYFGGEEEVRIPFPHSITGGCLKVEQTGFSESFDWSVTEVIGLQVEGT